ncbi:MAG: hypothetical protein IJ371_06270 [Clostridia bacterium]|nr:hypothetical protein [Clostridia bacterium]
MLKIKDNIDLKELEKYGFKPEYEYLLPNVLMGYSKHSIRIWNDRSITKRDAHFGEIDIDLLYDLIKDGLVVKVDE